MAQNPLPIRLAQILGITTSSLLAGSVLSISFLFVPRMLEAPAPLLLRQWAGLYENGKRTAPPLTALSAICYFYLAYKLPLHAEKSKFYGYLLAGTLSVAIVPFTFTFMAPTNNKLLIKAKETKTLDNNDEVVEVGLGEETAHKLLDRWGVLNVGRGVILIAATLLGAWTVLE